MQNRSSLGAAVLFLSVLFLSSSFPVSASVAGSSGYDELVQLFEEWREFQKPVFRDGVPDYTAAAMEEQHQKLAGFQQRLDEIDTAGWTVEQQIDSLLVRAEMNGLDFDHRVLRPWERDPAFYSVVGES